MRQDDEHRETAVDDGSLGKTALSRRDFLRFAGLAGASIGAAGGFAGFLAACADVEETTSTPAAGGATTSTTAATPSTTASTRPQPPAQDKIVIGAARSISGTGSFFEQWVFGPAYKLWAQDVNAAGGIDVAGKKLPVEIKIYDDESKLDNCVRLFTKLIEEDEVDFVLGPVGNDVTSAVLDVTNAHKYILISTECLATTLETEMGMGKWPYYFQTTPSPNHYQMPTFADICEELGIKSVAVIYLKEPMSIDFQAGMAIHLSARYIDVAMSVALPLDFKVDMTDIIKQAQDLDVDAVCIFAFPNVNILCMQTMIGLDYSPRAVLLGGGGAFQSFYDAFQGAMEGVMYIGAWSVNSSPEAKAYYEKLVEFVGGPENIEFSTQLLYRAQLEFFQQAIERAATLDQEVIVEVMRTTHFRTCISPDTFFTNQSLDASCYAGQIGQWQKGIAEVVDVGDKRTAVPIYPKAPWPQPPPAS